MQAPFYLTFGSLTIEAGSAAGPYHVLGMRLPAPDPDGAGGWRPAVREFRIRVTGANPVAVDANVAALRQSLTRGALVSLQVAATTVVLTTRIREAAVSESEFDPLERSVSGEPKMYVTVTLTTDPHWLAPWSAWTNVTVPAPAPYHFDITDPGGEDDALVSLRMATIPAGSSAYIGAMPNPAASYRYTDTFSTTLTLTSSYQRITPAAALSSRYNAGRHAVIVYADPATTMPAGTSIRSYLRTSSYNMTSVRGLTGASVATSTHPNQELIAPVTLPAHGIPSTNIVADLNTTHYLELMRASGGSIKIAKLQRVPLHYAALAVESPSVVAEGFLYDGDDDCVYYADADGVGPFADVFTVIKPLRAVPSGVTRYVYGFVTASVDPTLGTLQYRTRARYLSATG